ncbi:hypothetical protein KOW79_019739 [Hemibagrus wyckioides]|uniref:Uncharacterized protein n=1 Tax=Hemibagrus wyckioides TaxID=337641 RepID=A0A9D3N685_9TELE|nr:hypothetical protein KOW79_019739 [Hemibagrus wyckioides]
MKYTLPQQMVQFSLCESAASPPSIRLTLIFPTRTLRGEKIPPPARATSRAKSQTLIVGLKRVHEYANQSPIGVVTRHSSEGRDVRRYGSGTQIRQRTNVLIGSPAVGFFTIRSLQHKDRLKDLLFSLPHLVPRICPDAL